MSKALVKLSYGEFAYLTSEKPQFARQALLDITISNSLKSTGAILLALESNSIQFELKIESYTKYQEHNQSQKDLDFIVSNFKIGQHQSPMEQNGLSYDSIVAEAIQRKTPFWVSQMESAIARLEDTSIFDVEYDFVKSKTSQCVARLQSFFAQARKFISIKEQFSKGVQAIRQALAKAQEQINNVLLKSRQISLQIPESQALTIVPGLLLEQSVVEVLLKQPLFWWQTSKIINNLRRMDMQLKQSGELWTTENIKKCIDSSFTSWGKSRCQKAHQTLEQFGLLSPVYLSPTLAPLRQEEQVENECEETLTEIDDFQRAQTSTATQETESAFGQTALLDEPEPFDTESLVITHSQSRNISSAL
jgi:hypothetical protein